MSKNKPDLQSTIDLIAKQFVFDADTYPLLAKLDEVHKHQFALSHNLKHMNKQLGRIATHLEDVDHGGNGNPKLLEEALVKEFINILRMTDLLDLSAKELLDAVPKYLK